MKNTELDLQGMENELAILSSRTANVAIMEQCIADVGDDPDAWLPLFYSRRV